jgi:hypothetical protein
MIISSLNPKIGCRTPMVTPLTKPIASKRGIWICIFFIFSPYKTKGSIVKWPSKPIRVQYQYSIGRLISEGIANTVTISVSGIVAIYTYIVMILGGKRCIKA